MASKGIRELDPYDEELLLELNNGDWRANYTRVKCPKCKETRPMKKVLVASSDHTCYPCAHPYKPFTFADIISERQSSQVQTPTTRYTSILQVCTNTAYSTYSI